MAWLDQAFAHCPIFPTAASRRSLGRVSVPVWLIILSDQLPIVALVGHYPTNKLMGRRLISRRPKTFSPKTNRGISSSFPELYHNRKVDYLRVTHPSATKSEDFVRLACVKPATSVRSEPGSNSPIEKFVRFCTSFWDVTFDLQV